MYAHSAHIPQPPHTTGRSYQGLRTRIDPEQIPSPVDVTEYDQEIWENKQFMTLPHSSDHVPLSTTNFIAIDQGNSSPRFIRPTTWHLPSSASLADACHIPLAAIVQPFAEEESVPTVDCTVSESGGPPRCAACRAYLNPWCRFTAGGARWQCNLCKHETEVDADYFCPLDSTQQRTDILSRPELCKGTVDFVVGPAYNAPIPSSPLVPTYVSFTSSSASPPLRQPIPRRTLFVLDIAQDSVASGFLATSCTAILSSLYGTDAAECFPPGCSVAFITFDTCIQFYNLNSLKNREEMLVIPDVENEMFCPLPTDTFFVDPYSSRNVIEQFLVSLPERFSSSSSSPTEVPSRLSAVLPAFRASAAALTSTGGQLIFFGSSYPSFGPGAVEPLLPEAESKFYDTDKEKILFVPDNTWRELATEFAESGVGVELCLSLGSGNFGYIDVKNLGVLATFTGGETRLFSRFDPIRDEGPLKTHVIRVLSREGGYNVQATVRLSKGLSLVKAIGGFVESNLFSSLSFPSQPSSSSTSALPVSSPTSTLSFGTLHADSALAIEYTYTGAGLSSFFSGEKSLDTREYAFIQCAFLYTTYASCLKRDEEREGKVVKSNVVGERRVRVLNLALTVAELAGNVFRFADQDATVAYLAKEVMSELQQGKNTLANLRDGLTERCSRLLLAYRRQCAAATSPTQLILPEAFKLLPLYVLCLHKNRSLRAHNVASDLRNYCLHRLLMMPTHLTLRNLYPRFMALHDLTDNIALPVSVSEIEGTEGPTSRGHIQLPSLMRNTFTGMHADGVYLIDNEEVVILWIGSSVSPQILIDLFDVEAVQHISPSISSLPHLSSRLSSQVRNILESRRIGRYGVEKRFLIARQNLDGTELEFSDMLVEDTNCGTMSYVDYLCFVHKQINVALTNNTNIEQVSNHGLRGTPW